MGSESSVRWTASQTMCLSMSLKSELQVTHYLSNRGSNYRHQTLPRPHLPMPNTGVPTSADPYAYGTNDSYSDWFEGIHLHCLPYDAPREDHATDRHFVLVSGSARVPVSKGGGRVG